MVPIKLRRIDDYILCMVGSLCTTMYDECNVLHIARCQQSNDLLNNMISSVNDLEELGEEGAIQVEVRQVCILCVNKDSFSKALRS